MKPRVESAATHTQEVRGIDASLATNADGQSSDTDSPTGPSTNRWRLRHRPDAPTWTFVGLLLAAAAFFAVRGADQWFYVDDWAFVTRRDGADLDSLLAAHHHQHWVTLPAIVFRLVWNVAGMHVFWPYRVVAIALHLVVGSLLWTLMRRSGVRPWLATAAAGVFLFYGTGSEAVMWVFMITFTGALALGLGQLLLADRSDQTWPRYVAGLACGLGALMCSGLGPIMVAITGAALFLRHGWRRSAAHTLPLAVVFVLWNRSYAQPTGTSGPPALSDLVTFVRTGLAFALRGLSRSPVVAGLLLVLVATGLLLVAWPRRRSVDDLRTSLGIPVALVGGTLALLVANGISRVEEFGPSHATRGRFAYVILALLLPVIAIGLEAVVERWPRLLVPVLAVLLVGVPGNLAATKPRQALDAGRDEVLAVASSPALARAPGELVPFPDSSGLRVIDVAWLRWAIDDGRVPAVDPAPEDAVGALARLALRTEAWNGDPSSCTPLRRPVDVDLEAGGSVGFTGVVYVQVVRDDVSSTADRMGSFEPRAVVTTTALTLRLTPHEGLYPETICR